MQRMRLQVKEHNVYRWAGNLITALANCNREGRRRRPIPRSLGDDRSAAILAVIGAETPCWAVS